MPSVQAAGVQTFYQDIGRHKETLVLLHGWGNSWEAWGPLIPLLAAQYRLVIPDLPGFGKSESPAQGWNTPQYVAWLKAFLHAARVQELEAVIGHSYGGKLAAFAWFADGQELPAPTRGVFLIGPSGIPTPLSPTRTWLSRLLPLIPLSLRRGLLAPARRFLYLTLLGEKDYLSASAFQEETLRRILPEDIQKRVKDPVPLSLRFCWGEHDAEMPVWMAYPYSKISSQSHVFVVKDTAHFPHHTHPQLVHAWLEAWL